jgi:hypothetical protein
MKKVRLELQSFRILRKREKWNIYFILYMTDPEDPDRTVIRIEPSGSTLSLSRMSGNHYDFRGTGPTGLGVAQLDIPGNRTLNVRLKMMQSRSNSRNAGEKIKVISEAIDLNQLGVQFLSKFKWFLVEQTVDTVEKLLSASKDRELGFLSMDMLFDQQFEKQGMQEVTNRLTSGFAEITWVWKVL